MTSVIITAEESADLSDLVRDATAAGLTDVRTIEGLRLVAGSIPEDRLGELQRLNTVKAVERDRSVGVPPPDSPIQ